MTLSSACEVYDIDCRQLTNHQLTFRHGDPIDYSEKYDEDLMRLF